MPAMRFNGITVGGKIYLDMKLLKAMGKMKLRVLEGKNILFIEVNAFYQLLRLCTVARQLLYAI